MTTTEYLTQLIGNDQSIDLQGFCHDCKSPVTITVWIDNGKLSSTGSFWHIEGVGDFCKCQECFEADDMLRNYQPCEVYSRVVGYLRPIKQWNPGKKAEKELRKDFVF